MQVVVLEVWWKLYAIFINHFSCNILVVFFFKKKERNDGVALHALGQERKKERKDPFSSTPSALQLPYSIII